MNPWLQTLGGGALDLCDPKPEQICFRTIARVLSRVPRFGGHTEQGVLSVGQHCLEGAAAMRRDGHSEAAQVAFLLHDAHEYVLGDKATPVAQAQTEMAWRIASKHGGISPATVALIVKESWAALKHAADVAIHRAAGIPFPLAPDVAALVHEYDRRMCVTERNARLAPPSREWGWSEVPVEGCDLWHWSAGTVEKCYLAALQQYGVRV